MAQKPGYWTSLHGLTTIILISAAVYYLLVEHGEHTLQYLPFLIILLCPLMHLFMHKGHGGHHQDAEEAYRRGLEDGQRAGGDKEHDA